jgi:prepilin-type processing-associated H-X9-DG protein
MKQWALAMHNYHATFGQLPWGSHNNPRQTYVMYLWTYVEQSALAQQNDVTQPFYVPPGTIGGTMNGLCGQFVKIYNCPDDYMYEQNGAGTWYQRVRGNYLVNWGNVKYDTAPTPATQGPFYHVNGNRSTPGAVRFTDIVDGTSNTLMMSEGLRAWDPNDDDWRGDIHNDDGVFKFMTLLTPNSSAPDVVNWAIQTGDPLMPVTTAGSEYSAARSRHTGGVNAARCDGSVSFVTNSISLNTWQALGSMSGGEVISDN